MGDPRRVSGMGNTARPRGSNSGFSSQGADNDSSVSDFRTPLARELRNNSAWGNSAWAPLWSKQHTVAPLNGLGTNARDQARLRGAFPANGHSSSTARPAPENGYSADHLGEKRGSRVLIESSELDESPSPWGDTGAATNPRGRSSGVSPARKMSHPQAYPAQQYSDASASPYFLSTASRNGSQNQGPVAKPNKPGLDPTSDTFEGFNFEGFSQPSGGYPRTDNSAWSDAASVHSPGDDRQNGYFSSHSTAQSRSNSITRARHDDAGQYIQNGQYTPNGQYAPNGQYTPNGEDYMRLSQPGSRQHSSFSHPNGRPSQERSGSIQSDSLGLPTLSYRNESDSALQSHRPSFSGAEHLSYNGSETELAFAPNHYADHMMLPGAEDSGYPNMDTYTVGNPSHYMNGQAPSVRSPQFDNRSVPNGTGVRQSPMYSNTHTPPYDHLYPSGRSDRAPSNGPNLDIVRDRLAGFHLQQQQQQYQPRAYNNTNQLPQQQFHPMINSNNAAANMRAPYNYPFGMNVHMANFAIPLPGHVSWEPPKGPRDQDPNAPQIMSAPLQNFKKMYNRDPKKFQLKDIYGHIVEFSGDQHGSRFIQGLLEQANSDEKAHVFSEIKDNSVILMKDVFGNYVVQKFFEYGTQAQKTFLAMQMKGHVRDLTINTYGCRVLQKALEFCLLEERVAIVKELEGKVIECVENNNGNHVIQKAITQIPQQRIPFVVDAFRGKVATLAVHQYGCRVIQRILERCDDTAKRFIFEELLADAKNILTHSFGNYVVQHIIRHHEVDREQMIDVVKNDVIFFSKHKFASNVVEKSFEFGTEQQRLEMTRQITARNDNGTLINLVALLQDPYGNYVIQKMLDIIPQTEFDDFVAILKPEVDKLQKGPSIKALDKVIERLDGKRFQNSPTRTNSLSEVPPLVNDAPSPQSSGVPSANTSTIDDPVHTTPIPNKVSVPVAVPTIAKAE